MVDLGNSSVSSASIEEVTGQESGGASDVGPSGPRVPPHGVAQGPKPTHGFQKSSERHHHGRAPMMQLSGKVKHYWNIVHEKSDRKAEEFYNEN